MIKACILDMDGVIVDTEGIHVEAFRQFLHEHSIHYSEELLLSFIGYSIEDNITDIKKRFPNKVKMSTAAAVKRRNNIYLTLLSQQNLQPQPGLLELIDYCNNHTIKLAVASSSDFLQVDLIMKKIAGNYEVIFDAVITGDDVSHKKPAPDIYNKTVEKLAVPAHSCIAFEDSSAGIQSAKAAGINCVAVRSQYTTAKDLQNAGRIVDSLHEPVINNFWER